MSFMLTVAVFFTGACWGYFIGFLVGVKLGYEKGFNSNITKKRTP